MITLTLYLHNAETGTGPEYNIQKLYFEDNFFIGTRRHERYFRIVRTFAEGNMILKNKDDFDSLKDYFSSSQDGSIIIEGEHHFCRINFIQPNFLTKTVKMNLYIFDEYSLLLDGVRITSQDSSHIPQIELKKLISELPFDPKRSFVDASSYQYGSLWGEEIQDITEDAEIQIENILKWNTGGDDLKLEDICVGTAYKDDYYIPSWIKYTDKGAGQKFKECRTIWKREYRYFPEIETVPSDWNSVGITQEINGLTYHKYVRRLDGSEEKWFRGDQNYFIRDESDAASAYMTSEYQGYSTDLQKSRYFYEVKDLVKALIDDAVYLEDFNMSYTDDLYISSMKNLNVEGKNFDRFDIRTFIEFFQDKFGMYFHYDGTDAGIEYMNWKIVQLLDIENFKSRNWYKNNEPEILQNYKKEVFNSGSSRLDFRNQTVSFYNYEDSERVRNEGIITDVELTDESADNFIIINTNEVWQDQIFEQFQYYNLQVGTEAILRTMNGKFISWDSELLDRSSYIGFDLVSNGIYCDIDQNIRVSFGYVIYEGDVTIRCGNLEWNLTAGMSSNSTIGNGQASSITPTMTVHVNDPNNSGVRGFIFNIKVETLTRTPVVAEGIISGQNIKNGNLALANTIKNYRVPMSYSKGYLEDYGLLEFYTDFSKEIESTLPLDEGIFDKTIYEKYLLLGLEKYCIFERKRQVLTENNISNFDIIKAKTDAVY